MPNLPVGARVNISPSALARSEPVAVARRWTACAKANDHRSGKTIQYGTRSAKPTRDSGLSVRRDISFRENSATSSDLCAPPLRDGASRRARRGGASALSTSRRCVRCAPRRTIPRVSHETSAPPSRVTARIRPPAPRLTPSRPLLATAPGTRTGSTRGRWSLTAASDSPSDSRRARVSSRDASPGGRSAASPRPRPPRPFPRRPATVQATVPARKNAARGRPRPDGACVRRLRQLAAEENTTDANCEAPLLRIAVDGGGCSGFQYAFRWTPPRRGPRDRVFGEKARGRGGRRVVRVRQRRDR